MQRLEYEWLSFHALACNIQAHLKHIIISKQRQAERLGTVMHR